MKVQRAVEHRATFTAELDADERYEVRKRFASTKSIRVTKVVVKSSLLDGEKKPERDFLVRGVRALVNGNDGNVEGDSYWDLTEARRLIPKKILDALLAEEKTWLEKMR